MLDPVISKGSARSQQVLKIRTEGLREGDAVSPLTEKCCVHLNMQQHFSHFPKSIYLRFLSLEVVNLSLIREEPKYVFFSQR
jgi:hypothetical protein